MDQVAALKERGNAALAENHLDEAIKCYSEALELDDKNAVLYSNRSAAYAKAGLYERSLQDAEKAIELRPDWPKAYSRKAAALAYMGRRHEASYAYESGLLLDPENRQLREGLAEVKRANAKLTAPFGDLFTGVDVLGKLRNDPRTAPFMDDPTYLQMVSQLETDPLAANWAAQDPRMLVTMSVLLGLPDTASQDEPMDSPKPSGAPPEPQPQPEPELPENVKQARAEKELGNASYKRKDFEDAILHYTKALQHDPTDITYYNNLAAVYFEQKAFDECIAQCEKGVEVGRENRADFKMIAKALTRIGNAYKKKKDYRTARTYYEKAMSEHRTPEIRTLLSGVDKLIREEETKSYVNPELAEQEKERGNELFKQGDYATAVKHYTEAIRRNPQDAKLYSNRAACYTKLAAFDLGLKDCERCLELDPKFIKGWIRKGTILQGMQQASKAIAAYQKALEIDPSNAEALQGYRSCRIENASMDGDQDKIRQRAMGDPEVQAILRDPAMRMILEQMQDDPRAVQDHLKNPDIAAKIQKLLSAGLIAIR
ncbi:hypothetical protein HUJ04_000116 [Dendroctonus ponderosae]|uniref:Stress-induced-phosphoprotein 1 n=2 Tax=Dendroctonus ponderosae TaxID=77166 RepID=A0AAR5Q6H9_DENPD|nr:hypothetical protein HUJ04_000116 [Dendroctonus ponderosae]KAH1000195.1 hypothetical protein HUJ04_000116 [Dendroctonus ponderosae]